MFRAPQLIALAVAAAFGGGYLTATVKANYQGRIDQVIADAEQELLQRDLDNAAAELAKRELAFQHFKRSLEQSDAEAFDAIENVDDPTADDTFGPALVREIWR